MNVKQIVTEYLKENKYGGLWCNDCGCEVDDLAPCGEMNWDCEAGYRHPLRSRLKSLNEARALVTMIAIDCHWHADILNAEVGLFDKDGKALPDPDEEGLVAKEVENDG